MAQREHPNNRLWEYFHWKTLLKWDVFQWIIGTILAVGAFLFGFEQYWGTNVCFIITAVFVFAKIAQVAIVAQDPWWHRMILTFVLFGLCGVAIVETVRGVNRWADKHAKEGAPATLLDKGKDAPPDKTKEPAASDLPKPKPALPSSHAPQPSTPPVFRDFGTGNLGDRARKTADQILLEMPKQISVHEALPIQEQLWWETRYFHWRFNKPVTSLRDEFAQLHFRDEELDRLLERDSDWYNNSNLPIGSVAPLQRFDFDKIAECLRGLAAQLPTQPK